MARVTKPLTDTEIRKARPKPKEYTLADGEGLLVRVSPTGKKIWFFNYVNPVTLKRNKLSLGAFPEVSLREAREKRAELRALVRNNVDPKLQRQRDREALKHDAELTLQSVFNEWFLRWAVGKDEATVQKARRQLELYALPQLGGIPVSKLTAPIVIECLRPLERQGKHETLSRVRSKLSELMTYAVNTGLANHNPLMNIRVAFARKAVLHQPTLSPAELPVLMDSIETASIRPVTRFLIHWSLHTLLRPTECAGTRWDEIDYELNVWTVPPHRMKGGRRQQTVPLTRQMIAILETVRRISWDSEFVFPSERSLKRPASSQTVNRALVRMGLKGKQTAHGFRSLGSTTLNEAGFESDLIEAALAHVDSNTIRRAYNRSDFLEQRREMMQWWSDRLENCQNKKK